MSMLINCFIVLHITESVVCVYVLNTSKDRSALFLAPASSKTTNPHKSYKLTQMINVNMSSIRYFLLNRHSRPKLN